MAKLSLKNIIGKKNDTSSVVEDLVKQLGVSVWIEDENGKLVWGEKQGIDKNSFPITADNEFIGSVKGDAGGSTIAHLLSNLAQKEIEKKKLGSEVLNLYQEINVIFNFSEQLTQTIDPDGIAKITLEQAMHSVTANSGVIILWDEATRSLEIPSKAGEELFNDENLKNSFTLLLKIGLSGNSEIMTDFSQLKEKNIVGKEVQSLMYAAMKVKHRIMGAIILAGKKHDQFSAANLKLLVTLALQSSAAIESAMLYEKNIREVKEREEAILRIHEVTKKFVPHEFIRSLGKEALTDVKLGDQAEKIVTVLFTDIRDFTTLSERMTPEENFHFVSSFNARLGPIIRANNGFINQYLGDSIMAIFPHAPEDALNAAINMQKAVHDLNAERIATHLLPIRAGIGMHTGPLIMGITGDEHRMDAATISDTVNTAARIESLTKYYKSPLLLSQETLRRMKNYDGYKLRQLGSVRLKGKHNLLNIIECINGFTGDEFQKKMRTLELFSEAMVTYREQRFEQAIRLFQDVLNIDQQDLTAGMFLQNAMKYLREGIPENWTGAEEMITK